jgi:hypothetical protein
LLLLLLQCWLHLLLMHHKLQLRQLLLHSLQH